jgi:nitrogen fixation-related uncharacterized protein
MNPAIAFLISMTFLISVGGLFVMVWGLANDQWGDGTAEEKTHGLINTKHRKVSLPNI